MRDDIRINEILFDPPSVAALTKLELERKRKQLGAYKTGWEKIDNHYVMLQLGMLNVISADTSHGKSTFVTALAHNLIDQLKPDEAGMIVTLEDTIEKYGMKLTSASSGVPIMSLLDKSITDRQFDRLVRHAAKIGQSPLYVVGHSSADKTSRPRLSIDDVVLAVRNMINTQKRAVRFVVIDYLQMLNVEYLGKTFDLGKDNNEIPANPGDVLISDISEPHGIRAVSKMRVIVTIAPPI